MARPNVSHRHLLRLLTCVGALSLLLGLWPQAAAASAGGRQKPSDPLWAPTFQQQTANWTSSQLAAYQARLSLVQNLRKSRSAPPSGAQTPDYCFYGCFPNSHYMYMSDIWEGSADCACGPASAAEMYTSYNYYYGDGAPTDLGTVENEMASHGWYSCSNGTYRYGLADEMNLHQSQNNYVWQAVGGWGDVFDYSEADVASNLPPAYNGETYGPDGYPLDNYQGVDWRHYFPGYGYDANYNLYVADPHFGANHSYSSNAVYLFIDNFPYTNQVLW